MLGHKEKSETESIIGKGTEFKGTLKDKDSIRIDGKIEGKIQVEGDVIVGEGATVKADIQAKSITIGGKVIGNINCQGKVELFPSGVLEGDVKAHGLIIPEGALFNGKYRMTPFEEKKEQEPIDKGEETEGRIAIEPPKKKIQEPGRKRRKGKKRRKSSKKGSYSDSG